MRKPAMQCPNCEKVVAQHAIALDWDFEAENRRRFWDLAELTDNNLDLEGIADHHGVLPPQIHFFARTRRCSHCYHEYNTVELPNKSFYFLIQAVKELCGILESCQEGLEKMHERFTDSEETLQNLCGQILKVREKMGEQAQQNANAMLAVFDSQISTPLSEKRAVVDEVADEVAEVNTVAKPR